MTYRILSLDGGGTWAVLQVMALQALCPRPGSGPDGAVTGFDVLRKFDLAIANSGGAIVLGALMLDLPLDDIARMFIEPTARRQIFKKTFLGALLGHALPIPKYSTAAKREGLLASMGPGCNTFMSAFPAQADWPRGPAGHPVKACIVAFDYDQARATFFRTYSSALGRDASAVRLLDAVHASSDAPVIFFDKPTECDGRRYWDGAMGGYNNPLMAGVVEAAGLGAPTAEMAALTLGTATTRAPGPDATPKPPAWYVRETAKPGPIVDIRKAAEVINDDPPDAATFTAHVLFGGPPERMGRVVRMSPVVQPVIRDGAWTHPEGLTEPEFQGLKKLGLDAIDQADFDKVMALGRAWVAGTVPNQPVRFNSKTLAPEPGDATLADAVARWRAI